MPNEAVPGALRRLGRGRSRRPARAARGRRPRRARAPPRRVRTTSARSSRDLGGHDLGDVLAALAPARARRPTGRPSSSRTRSRGTDSRSPDDRRTTRRSSTGEQIDRFRASSGSTLDTEWDGFAPGRPEGELIEAARRRLDRGDRARRRVVPRPRVAHRARPARPDLDAGGVRPRPARALARRGRGRAARHGVARRLGLDEPRRLRQQGRGLGAGRGARLRRDGGLAAEMARRAHGPAHRDGHRRDEPRPAARAARPDLGLPAGAPPADRHRSTTRS